MRNESVPRDMRALYDSAARWCLSLKVFDRDLLCKGMQLDEDTCDELLGIFAEMEVIGRQDESGNFHINKNYNHSDYLLSIELENEPLKPIKKESQSLQRVKSSVERLIPVVAAIVFFTSIYFGFRSPMSLLLIIPVCLLVAVSAEKVGYIMSSLGVIVVCVISLLWINSIAPLWGDKYETRLRYEEIKKQERQGALEDSYRVTNAESAVRQSMKDPTSAQFKMSKLMPSGAVCGQVNGKNSFGAYTGYERFIYYSGIAAIDDGSSSFSSTWNSNCN